MIEYNGIICGNSDILLKDMKNFGVKVDLILTDPPYNLNKDFPLPEYLFFFDMDPEKSLERVFARANKTGEQTEIYEKLDFQKKTYQEYKNVIEFYSKPEFSDMKIIIIDASKSIQEIHEKILSIIKDLPILKV